MPEKKTPPGWFAGVLFSLLFLTSLGFQIHSGAWRSDFGGHADEAAHVVTSLMVRDYLAGGFLETPHPKRYAEAYYERFPKVALGHYPPGFYLVASAGLLPFRSGETLLVLMNLIAAGTGLLVWSLGRRLLEHDGQAALIAFLYIVLPQTRTYTAIIMADLLLVFLGLLAALSFHSFLRSGSARDALFFGLAAAGAILTKGSGIGLALLPPVALLLSGKGKWFLSPRLWLAPVPVLVLALPWMLFSMGITQEGMQASDPLEWFLAAAPFYGSALLREGGWVAAAAVLVAAGAGGLRILRHRQSLQEAEAVLWALVVCGIVIPLMVPAGLDARYLMPVMPVILLLGALQLRRLAAGNRPALGTPVAALFALLVFGETLRPVQKLYTGASAAVQRILEEASKDPSDGPPSSVLAVSNATGEGALIAAAALAAPDSLTVARGSKLLSTSDWMGRGYRQTFETPQELMGILSEKGIDYLVCDPPPAGTPLAHWRILDGWLEGNPGFSLPLVGIVPSWRRLVETRFAIYRVGGREAGLPGAF
jgi:hypothetical protein